MLCGYLERSIEDDTVPVMHTIKVSDGDATRSASARPIVEILAYQHSGELHVDWFVDGCMCSFEKGFWQRRVGVNRMG